MTDERLTRGLKAVLDPVPVPDRLTASPEALARQRLAAGPSNRRPARWRMAVTAAAVAVAVIAAASFTAPGHKALAAARELGRRVILTLHVQSASPEERAEMAEEAPPAATADWIRLKPGETREMAAQTLPSGAVLPRTVAHGTTLEAMRTQVPDLPLPTYLPPGADAKAVIIETYDGERVTTTTCWVTYSVELDGQKREIGLRYLPVAGSIFTPVEQNLTVFTPPEQNLTRTVTVNGQEATAVSFDGGKTWSIYWQTPAGQGFIGGFLPLDELVKVVASMPMLQP